MFLAILKAHSQINFKELNTPQIWHYKDQHGLVRKAKTGDGIEIASDLRKADLVDIRAFSNDDPAKVLEESIANLNEFTYVIEQKGVAIAIFGIVPHSNLSAVIWMIGTNKLVKVKIPFLRNCKFWVEAFSELYPVLFNAVSKANTLHISWLKWLGFKFTTEHKEFGLNKEPFIEFIKVKN